MILDSYNSGIVESDLPFAKNLLSEFINDIIFAFLVKASINTIFDLWTNYSDEQKTKFIQLLDFHINFEPKTPVQSHENFLNVFSDWSFNTVNNNSLKESELIQPWASLTKNQKMIHYLFVGLIASLRMNIEIEKRNR